MDGEYNIVVVILHVCCEYVAIFSVAYLLHVASCYNPFKIGRCVGNRKGPTDDTWRSLVLVAGGFSIRDQRLTT